MVRRYHYAGLAAPLLLAGAALAERTAEWQTLRPGGDTLCANGTPYEFHARRADSNKVMIFFNGGGACWNGEDCDPANNIPGKSINYRVEASPQWGNDPRAYDGAFALDKPDNPFRDWSQVFVSYCTGDVHLGTRDIDYPRDDGSKLTIHHRGRVNAQAALDYLYEEFPEAQRLFVAGASAGAISSPYYAAEIAQLYPAAAIVQFAGGGGGYRLPPPTELWRNWGVFDQLPSWFDQSRYTEGSTQLLDLYRAAAAAQPDIRFYLYDTAYDHVQELFHAKLGHPVALYSGLQANLEDLQESLPYMRSYVAAGEFHTLLRYSELYSVETNGVKTLDWVNSIAAGEEVDSVSCGDASRCAAGISEQQAGD